MVLDSARNIGVLKDLTKYGATFMPLDLNMEQKEKAVLYIALRDAYQKLYTYEAEEQTENKQMRESLNVYYDAFFIRFGNLNAKQNVKFILMDASGRDMLSLERVENGHSQNQTSSTTRSLFRLTRSVMSILQRKRSPPHSTSSAVSTCRI